MLFLITNILRSPHSKATNLKHFFRLASFYHLRSNEFNSILSNIKPTSNVSWKNRDEKYSELIKMAFCYGWYSANITSNETNIFIQEYKTH